MMKNTSKTTKKTTSISGPEASAGPEGVAIAPPAYGIDFLDHAATQAEAGTGPHGGLALQRKTDPSTTGDDTGARPENRSGAGGEYKNQREVRLQRAATSPLPVNAVPPLVHEVLLSPGQPLDARTRAFMEPRFGHDFSGVRIHTDGKAEQSAREVNAAAYTTGKDIVLGRGQNQPSTESGQRLLAHELIHVVQQQTGAILKEGVNDVDTHYERQADEAANQLSMDGFGKSLPAANIGINDSYASPIDRGAISIQRRVLGIEADLRRRPPRPPEQVNTRKPRLTPNRNAEDPCCWMGEGMQSKDDAKTAYEEKRAQDLVSIDLRVTAKKKDGTDGPTNYVKGVLSASILDDLEDLLYAASAEDEELWCADKEKSLFSRTFRDLEGQWIAFHDKSNPQHLRKGKVALPGTSDHGTGKAIDFNVGYAWLLKNAGKYGWVNLPTERWHYDHISTPKVINRAGSLTKSTDRVYVNPGEKEKEREAFRKQYDVARPLFALRWNQQQNYSREKWLEVQQYIGMPIEDRSGMVDEKTVKAVMDWQASFKVPINGMVEDMIDMFMALGGRTKKGSSPVTHRRHRRSIQRKPLVEGLSTDKTKIPKEQIRVGWSGTVKNSINAEITGWKVTEGRFIRRIPLEGLSCLRPSAPEDLTQEKQHSSGRAIVLVPSNVIGAKEEEVEVLIHLHGHTAGYMTTTPENVTAYGAHIGQTEDLDTDKIVQQLDASNRKMIAILPQGYLKRGGKDKYGRIKIDDVSFGPDARSINCDRLIDDVFSALENTLKWKNKPKTSHVILSGFSGGGNTVVPMLKDENKSSLPPSGLNELVLFDALHGKAAGTVIRFLEKRLEEDLRAIKEIKESNDNKSPDEKMDKETIQRLQKAYIVSRGFRFRGITTGYSEEALKGKENTTYGLHYQEIQDFLYYEGREKSKYKKDKKAMGWFPRNAADLGGKESDVYKAFSANYQVIFLNQGTEKHGTLMQINDSLKEALMAGPP